jgi:hypothetical protein
MAQIQHNLIASKAGHISSDVNKKVKSNVRSLFGKD